MPRRMDGPPAPVLHEGTPEEAGVKPDAAESIRARCQQWYEDSREPFVVFVARHGVIVIHEAFGEQDGDPVSLTTPMEMASISKAITGMMFAQFVDQGLIAIDDPVGKFLPDFPVEGDKAITLRHCFTHTSGLDGHFEWRGVYNPWLDNVIANGLEYLEPGTTLRYNGVGYDLAGKVMEVVAGKSILRLMQENFLQPLGATNTNMADMACCTQSTAEDIARMAQLMLNRGAYGDLRFFSPETFEQLLPRRLDEFYPVVHMEWGIGLVWERDPHPDAGKNDIPAGAIMLGHNTIGHGAASSAVLRIDLDNDLLVVVTRNRAGPRYEEHLPRLLLTIAQNLTH
jgi:CubicO group peptidase (beta-lactamase class C family)